MAHRTRWGIAVALVLGFCFAAQAQESYLDEVVVHVAPGKRPAFDALVKKMVAGNRSHQGDTWTTTESAYGQNDTVTIVSGRESYGDIEKASGVFMSAMVKSVGVPATLKLFEDLSSCATDTHSVLLRVRPDLSNNIPSDPAERSKIIGGTRWIRTTRIAVRFGMGARFEELAKQVKTAREKTDAKTLVWITQSAAGDFNSVYYVNQLESSMAGFDAPNADLGKILGNEAYEKLLKAASEIIENEEVTISHFIPELSNPPEEIVNAAPDFWRPKPAAAKSTAAAKPAETKTTDKK